MPARRSRVAVKLKNGTIMNLARMKGVSFMPVIGAVIGMLAVSAMAQNTASNTGNFQLYSRTFANQSVLPLSTIFNNQANRVNTCTANGAAGGDQSQQPKVFHHLSLWRNCLHIDNRQGTFMYITKVLEQIEPKSRQPVLMSDYQCLYFPSDDLVNQGEKLWALKVESSPNFFEVLYIPQALSDAELFHNLPLVLQLRALSR
jgi:hypothetical protein